MERSLVSVVLPVHNEESFISRAVQSVLMQHHQEWELIIVDDHSTDSTADIVGDFNDRRIRLISASGHGIACALNCGLAVAKSAIVARFDADDIMLPDRLSHQLKHFNHNPKLGVLGSWSRDLLDGRRLRGPTSHALIGRFLQHGNCMSHPTIMMHRGRINGDVYYDPEMESIEDFDLWLRLYFDRGVVFMNCPKVLLLQNVQGDEAIVHARLLKAQELLRKRNSNLKIGLGATGKVSSFEPWEDLQLNEWLAKRLLLLKYFGAEFGVQVRDLNLAMVHSIVP